MFRLAVFLEGDHDFGCLLRVAATSGRHENIRLRDAQLFEKNVIHFPVIMLAGMDDFISQPVLLLQSADDRCNFHEIGPRAGDEIDLFLHDFLSRNNEQDCKPSRSGNQQENIGFSCLFMLVD